MNQTIMQLPKVLQQFPQATLIVAADTVHANIYLLGGDSLEPIDTVVVPRENREDNEGEFRSSDGTRTAGPESDVSDESRMTNYTKQIAAKIDLMVRKHSVAVVHMIMPIHVSRRIVAILPGDVKGSIGKTLDLDLMKSAPLELVERLVETE